MKILVLTDQIYPDYVSGVSKNIFNECMELKQQGHEITILTRSLLAENELPTDDLHIIRFRGPSPAHFFYYLFPLAIIYHTWRWLRQQKDPFDIFYAHNPFFLLGIRFANVSRTPVVYTFHASVAAEVETNAQHKKYGVLSPIFGFIAVFLRIFERGLLSTVDMVLPRSQFTAKELKRVIDTAPVPESHDIIPLGLDLSHYNAKSSSDARRQLQLPQDRFIIITVRRLAGRMGLFNLVSAVDEIQKQHPEVLLLIVGKGPLRASLEEQISKKQLESYIHLLGYIDEQDLPNYLAASDLFVLPTEHLEGFGLATIEALAVGKPVLGTPIGATPEILEPLSKHLLTRDSSHQALAESIDYWASHPQLLAEVATQCRSYAETRFNIVNVVSQLVERFQVAKQHKNETN